MGTYGNTPAATRSKAGPEDLAILANQWLQPSGTPSADIAPMSGDGIIDFRDFAVFAQCWDP